jgi:hypothetical protein
MMMNFHDPTVFAMTSDVFWPVVNTGFIGSVCGEI